MQWPVNFKTNRLYRWLDQTLNITQNVHGPAGSFISKMLEMKFQTHQTSLE